MKYRDLYIQSDTLLPADVFNNFRNIFIDIYGLDPAHFPSYCLDYQAVFNPNKAGLFDGSFIWGAGSISPPFHISKRTYLISI